MDQMLDDSIARQRMSMLVFVVFAAVALTLASVGLYGVVAHGVTERTHEIGVRMALGAEQRHVLGLVIRQGLSMALRRHGDRRRRRARAVAVDSGLLFGVTATDPAHARCRDRSAAGRGAGGMLRAGVARDASGSDTTRSARNRRSGGSRDQEIHEIRASGSAAL